MFSISAKLEANLDPNDLLAAYGLEKGMNRARTAGASAYAHRARHGRHGSPFRARHGRHLREQGTENREQIGHSNAERDLPRSPR